MTIDEKVFNVVGEHDYYPFGAMMENRKFTNSDNIIYKYKFTEKESDTETNLIYCKPGVKSWLFNNFQKTKKDY